MGGKVRFGRSGRASVTGSMVSRGVRVGEDSRVEALLWLSLLLQLQFKAGDCNCSWCCGCSLGVCGAGTGRSSFLPSRVRFRKRDGVLVLPLDT